MDSHKAGRRSLFVTEAKPEAGQAQVGSAYATEADATAAMAEVAECQAVDTNPDTDYRVIVGSRSLRGRAVDAGRWVQLRFEAVELFGSHFHGPAEGRGNDLRGVHSGGLHQSRGDGKVAVTFTWSYAGIWVTRPIRRRG